MDGKTSSLRSCISLLSSLTNARLLIKPVQDEASGTEALFLPLDDGTRVRASTIASTRLIGCTAMQKVSHELLTA